MPVRFVFVSMRSKLRFKEVIYVLINIIYVIFIVYILHFKKLAYNLFLEPLNLEVKEFNHGRSEMDCILPKVENKMTAVEKEGLDNFNRDCNQHGIIFWPKGEEFVDLCARLSNEYGTPIEKVSIILAVRFKSRLNMIC